MKFFTYQFLFAILVSIPVSAGADTIYLKDGSTITGKIKNVGAKWVAMSTASGDITIESARISRVDAISKTPQLKEQQAASSSPRISKK